MTGDITVGMSLVTFGNNFLKNYGDIEILTLDHPVFKFINRVHYQIPKRNWLFKRLWVEYAASPIEWLNKLKEEGCVRLGLLFEPGNVTLSGEVVPDHRLAWAVGGGGKRCIVTQFKDHAAYWVLRQDVTRKDAPDHKIWTYSYGRFAKIKIGIETSAIPIFEIAETKSKQLYNLKNISDFARSQKLDFWAEKFEKAIDLLTSSNPDSYFNTTLVPEKIMSLPAQQLLASAGAASVFGGMGSWNDFVFDTEEVNQAYNSLSADLYDSVNECIMAAVNSTSVS